ncbi:MAG: DUF2971 domain-containing protein [Ignavibacteriaceae bacterium]|nr:DUF2971 domain-containing protein [Ignavibacteriaceae bacterium]
MDTIKSLGIKGLYKFKTFDQNNYYQDILKNILYFPSVSQLNDPFDCAIPIRYDLCSKQEIFKICNATNSHYYPSANRSIRRKETIEQARKLRQEIRQTPDIVYTRINNYVENNLGVFALTEELKNLLLWAHYTDAHKGFCIEFDAQMLRNMLINGFIYVNKRALLLKINYENEFPLIHPTRNSTDDRARLQLGTKSKDWSYEREWRIIHLDGSRCKEPVPPVIIKRIYFGMLASEENIKTSVEILNKFNPKIEMFKATKKKLEFGLDFEPLRM